MSKNEMFHKKKLLAASRMCANVSDVETFGKAIIMKIHSSTTMDRVVEGPEQSMLGDGYIGFHTSCGEEVYGIDPDAGAEELVLVML